LHLVRVCPGSAQRLEEQQPRLIPANPLDRHARTGRPRGDRQGSDVEGSGGQGADGEGYGCQSPGCRKESRDRQSHAAGGADG
jgi:hypothetical protein